MKILNPSVEYWSNTDNDSHIAKCARLCYASDSTKGNISLLSRLITNGHLSMFRHGTLYFIVPNDKMPALPGETFCEKVITENQTFLSVNMQWALDNPETKAILEPYQVKEKDLMHTPGQQCIRKTFVVNSLISVSRELNRTSPNNIAEQSTRYVDFNKKGDVMISKPHWYDTLPKFKKFIARTFWKIDEWAYKLFRHWGMAAQDAREFLPLCTQTKVAYTYSLNEWEHILNLRYWGTTGKPHPNAKYIAGIIRENLVLMGFSEFVTCKDLEIAD